MNLTTRDTVLAVLAAFIWGATFPVSAIALEDTPPVFFTFLRFLLAASFVILVPRPKIGWKKLTMLGLFLGAGQYGFMFVAMAQGMPAGVAAVLVHTQAIFTVLIAVMFLNERPTVRTYLTIALAATGLACLMLDRAQGGAVIGFVLMILAALCGASGNVVLKSVGIVDMISVAVWMSLVPLLPLAILSYYLEADHSVADLFRTVLWKTVAAVAYSAVLATVVVYAIWGRLLVSYSISQVAPFFLLVPMFGLGLSAWLLDEEFSVLQLTGSALIFGGLLLSLPATNRQV
ncbi:EamA family transporter [uncultured Roseobacter sp.]|uniref:EamA family transporter n=1 Tax=uncultured Roseobacter sp. TaxID=114847 RepID=UPI002636B61D|nr:EamA family transporter [uncultured Roseobacter sp.]